MTADGVESARRCEFAAEKLSEAQREETGHGPARGGKEQRVPRGEGEGGKEGGSGPSAT